MVNGRMKLFNSNFGKMRNASGVAMCFLLCYCIDVMELKITLYSMQNSDRLWHHCKLVAVHSLHSEAAIRHIFWFH